MKPYFTDGLAEFADATQRQDQPIRRYWREAGARESTGRNRYGGQQRMVHTNAGCWVFVLAGRSQ